MKRTLIAAVLILALALSACGQQKAAEESRQGSEPAQAAEPAQIPNPWRDVTEEEAMALCPNSFVVPEGAENARWSVMENGPESGGVPGPLVQLTFDWYGTSYTAREQVTGDTETDLSGMYYTWTAQSDETLRTWAGGAMPCKTFRFIGTDEWADLCTWYDTEVGISYSLGVTAKDLDGFDILAGAEALSPTKSEPFAIYDYVIQEYLGAYENGNNNLEYVFGHAISEYVVGSEHLGYALVDLDDDGSPELIVGDPTASADLPIFGAYAISGGTYVPLCVSQARDRFFLRTDGSILNEGSGGAANSMVCVMVKSGDGLTGTAGVITSPGSNDDVLCWLQSGSVSYEPRPEDTLISLDEYQAKWMEWKSIVYVPELTELR